MWRKEVYAHFIMIYYLYPHLIPQWILHGNVIMFLFLILEMYITFLMSQMVESFEFSFCQKLICTARPHILQNCRETLRNKGYAKYREPGPRVRDKHKNSLLERWRWGGEAGFLSLGSKSEHQICSHCLWNLWNTLFFIFFKTLFMCLLAALHSIWDPISSTRDQISVPYIGNEKS